MGETEQIFRVEKVAVVGGGPAGIAAAKYLAAEECFSIDIFERRNDVGGLWNYASENAELNSLSRNSDVATHYAKNGLENGYTEQFESYQSPVYDSLEANLPKMLMQHSDLQFPDDEQLFPKHVSILKYLQKYAEEIRHLIRFSTIVVEITPLGIGNVSGWSVKTIDLHTRVATTNKYDAVIVANGHYEIPYVPPLPGLDEWRGKYPESIVHSKFYRRPQPFAGKKVLVVGFGPSGIELAFEIAHQASELLIASRTPIPSPILSMFKNQPVNLPALSSLDASTGTLHFDSSATITSIDNIIFCTGYLYSLPFLRTPNQAFPPPPTPRVSQTYHHIFSTHPSLPPTLTYVTLPSNIVPFPFSQAQAAAIARVYSGRLPLPSISSMRAWESARIRETSEGRAFHRLGSGGDVKELNWLAEWCETAKGEAEGRGKKAPVWREWEQWMRENTPQVIGAFARMEKQREEVRTLEALGFDWAAEASSRNEDEERRV